MAMEGVKSTISQSMTNQYQVPQNNSAEVETEDLKSVEVQPINKAIQQAKAEENNQENSQEKEPSDATIKQAIRDINKRMHNTIAEFGYHESTHRVTIKLKDKETDKVVKEIPAEKTLDMIAKAWELAGILVDEKR